MPLQTLLRFLPALILIAVGLFYLILVLFDELDRRRARREYRKLVRLFESGSWPEPGTIAKGEVKR